VITFIRDAIRRRYRRETLARELDLAIGRIDSIRMRTFRRSQLNIEISTLYRLRVALGNTREARDLDRITQSMASTRLKCDQLQSAEAHSQGAVQAAEARVGMLRQRASALPGDAFNRDIRRRRDSIVEECRRVREAKNLAAERTAATQIQQKMKVLEDLVGGAETVHSALPVVEAKIEALPRQQVVLDTETEVIYEDICATLKQARLDARRGDYGKAAQRLREVKGLEGNLLSRFDRRARWAREEINRWLDCAVVTAAFPELRQFPPSLDGASVERWYSLRTAIEPIVLEHASRQRAANVPVRRGSGFVLVPGGAPLALRLEQANDEQKLEAFLHTVCSYG
jgi:hypothetical protein